MEEQRFFVGVKAIFLNDSNEILVLETNPRHTDLVVELHWDLPGGRVKGKDSIEDTLKREVEEELGIKRFRIKGLFDACISKMSPHGKDGTSLALITFLCEMNEKGLELSDEHTGFKWAEIDEARKLLRVKFPEGFLQKLESLR